jgi:hypothetical protein
MDGLKAKLFSQLFFKNYIYLSSMATGSFCATYAAIYGIKDDSVKPLYISNQNDDKLITFVNCSIYLTRIPMYFACGSIVGGACSIIGPIVLPIWTTNTLLKKYSNQTNNEIKE